MDPRAEYLEADGLGGFTSGTVSGIRTRRYHALLLAATAPPTGRMVLVNGFDAWLETPAGVVALTSQAYLPDVTHPDGASRIASFQREPWPRWTFRLGDRSVLEHELVVRRGSALVALFWRLPRARPPAILCVRPFFSGRDYHALHHENGGFGFAPERVGDALVWRPYPGVPAVFSRANATFAAEPLWFRNFRYDEERARGLDFAEDLAAPGVLRFDLAAGEAVWLLAAAGSERELHAGESAVAAGAALRDAERTRRAAFATPLERAADAYVVRRGGGSTLVAGYPWFTDWGRDTFIALRGLCLATGRVALARDMLLEWAGAISDGMLPNRFADRREAPEYNAVDASLWYVVAVHELLAQASLEEVPEDARGRLHAAVAAVLEGYLRGTRHGIRVEADGLVAAGEPGVQLTWMDARVGERVITPRSGKPVEIQCLWLNALAGAAPRSARFAEILERGAKSFRERFWHEPGGFLYDVVDVEHRAGAVDSAFRPNQIFAVGGLPLALLEGEPARRLVDAVERKLWTPLGLRSLAPGEPSYTPHYGGGVAERDGAYHQGTVWPWLLGPFVDAWVRVRGGGARAKQEARRRFLAPLLEHLDVAGLGHVSEIADAEPPHTPAGCPFQAWSLGELLRLDRVLLAPRARPPR